MKIVINAEYGGFGIPTQIQEMYLEKLGIAHFWYQREGAINWDKPYQYVKKEFEDLDLRHNDALRRSCAHIADLGSEVMVDEGSVGCMSWKTWDDTLIEFYDRTRESNRSTGLKIDARVDPDLIEILELLTPETIKKMESFCNPVVVEIPDDVDWIIDEYDGYEWVAENHRTWHV